jgi:hypothetical protein
LAVPPGIGPSPSSGPLTSPVSVLTHAVLNLVELCCFPFPPS